MSIFITYCCIPINKKLLEKHISIEFSENRCPYLFEKHGVPDGASEVADIVCDEVAKIIEHPCNHLYELAIDGRSMGIETICVNVNINCMPGAVFHRDSVYLNEPGGPVISITASGKPSSILDSVRIQMLHELTHIAEDRGRILSKVNTITEKNNDDVLMRIATSVLKNQSRVEMPETIRTTFAYCFLNDSELSANIATLQAEIKPYMWYVHKDRL